MGYDSIFDPRQLNQVIVLSHFLFILIIPSSLFIDRIVLDLLRLYVWLYFSFVFFLPFPPPQVLREGTQQLDQPQHPAWRREMYCLDFPVLNYGFGQSAKGTFAVYLCFIYASLNNVLKTDYEGVMLCFWKGCCCNSIWLYEIKVCCSSAVYKYVFLYLSCISVTYTYKPPPKLGHSLWEWP